MTLSMDKSGDDQERALDRDRRAEERTRPVSAHVYVSPISGRASLTLVSADGGSNREPINLGGVYRSPEYAATTVGATKVREAGFRLVGGAYWVQHPDRRDIVTVAIEPTHRYLSYVARRFGPLPVPPAIPGATVEARQQRGWWDVTLSDGSRYALTWSPQLGGDRWTVWGGPTCSVLVRSHVDPERAVYALRYPSHIPANARP
ncbi:hypothetical protein ACWC0C_07100 [Streptomyces sp. NPDC001709]